MLEVCRLVPRPASGYSEIRIFCRADTGDGREKTFFEVFVGTQSFIVECGFECFGLAHVTLWLVGQIGFEWFEDLEAQY